MEIKGKVHCFFEQSGTFKNEFIKLGIPAEDYDIQNNFGQTDHVVDLFAEIEQAYDGGGTIFNSIDKNDMIMAFFPCIYFCDNNVLYFNGCHLNYGYWHMDEEQKVKYILDRSKKRQNFYELLLKMYSVCCRKNLRMILENPYNVMHYLHNNFPVKPAIIEKDRSKRGDYFRKPTAYWFVGCEPTQGFTYQKDKKVKRIQECKQGMKAGLCSEERSMISPDYARNFIRDNILGLTAPEWCSTNSLFNDKNIQS